MKKERLVKISAACAGLLLGLGALSSVKSGEILKSGNQPFSLYPGTQRTYKVALEVYNPSGTATIASNTEIAIRFDSNEISNGSVNFPMTVVFSFPDGDAKFSTSSNYRWVLVGDNNIIYAASDLGAVGPTITLTSDNVDFKGSGITSMPSGIYYLKQVSYGQLGPISYNYINEINEKGIIPTNPSIVLERHKASCTEFPTWRLSASIAGSNGNIYFKDVTFAYVTPQFSVATGPADSTLTASLDDEFQKFVLKSGPNVRNETRIFTDNFITLVDNSNADWIVKSTGYVGNLTFNIVSEIPVPRVTLKFNNSNCAGNGTNWTCRGSVFEGNHSLELTITGEDELPLTTWTFSNATFDPQFCLSLQRTDIGVWSPDGGLEAIVPFVKSDPALPAETYFVFHNRRNIKVKLFAVNMLERSERIIRPKTLIAEIEPQSTFRITGRDLGLKLNISEDALKNGVPIKFLFTAPGARPGQDPYIEGIVVSVYAGEQRSVPLKFRQSKHGDYNE